jgi:hypothetical protein
LFRRRPWAERGWRAMASCSGLRRLIQARTVAGVPAARRAPAVPVKPTRGAMTAPDLHLRADACRRACVRISLTLGIWVGRGERVRQSIMTVAIVAILSLLLSFSAASAELEVQKECIDLAANGVVPVVLFGSAIFDVRTVDLSTLRLAGASPAALGNGGSMVSLQDVNGDGYLDIKARFRQSDLNLTLGTTSVVLTGNLISGQSFTAADEICVR